eukprot:g4036.t1
MCRARLALAGVDRLATTTKSSSSTELESSSQWKAEDSFVILEQHRKSETNGPNAKQPAEDSFIMLGSLTSELQREVLVGEEEADRLGLGGSTDLDDKLRSLARMFELASEEGGVDHPLCVDCASQIKAQKENEKRKVEAEIADYSEAIKKLETEQNDLVWLSADEFEAQLQKAEEEFASETEKLERVERELLEAEYKIEQLNSVSRELDELEESYWHTFNDFSLNTQYHMDDKAALMNKINSTAEKLDSLRQTNVFMDVFRIDHDGPFGTISGFRLGKTPDISVDWDEINAAWGQAVLLLYTMANLCNFTFSNYKLVPMGSKPKIIEGTGPDRKVHELYGPVSKVWGFHYNKAMCCFLACLKEFAEFAHAEDLNQGQDEAFELPFSLEGDKVDGTTIRLSVNQDVRWTKALKFMLADLLACMKWTIQRGSSVV